MTLLFGSNVEVVHRIQGLHAGSLMEVFVHVCRVWFTIICQHFQELQTSCSAEEGTAGDLPLTRPTFDLYKREAKGKTPCCSVSCRFQVNKLQRLCSILHTEDKMKKDYSLEQNRNRRKSFTDDGIRWRTGSEFASPEYTDVTNSRVSHPSLFGKYQPSLQTLKPFRWSSPQLVLLDT
ncbi:hypothetical protein AMECASPLE_032730 [Ameca splendens]|uniref:Uncharacterized protein n=1 Tax=Ameca splendens TaxID=208324 RepID=A0ABV0YTV5_9TELE